MASPVFQRWFAEVPTYGFEHYKPMLRFREPEKRMKVIALKSSNSSTLQLQQVRLRRIDVDGVNCPGVLSQKAERIAASRADRNNGVTGLDLKGASV